MALSNNLTIPERGRRRLRAYVELLHVLPVAQLSEILEHFNALHDVTRRANRLFAGWHSANQTREEWAGPLEDAQREIDTLAQNPAFRPAIEASRFAGSIDEAVYVLKEVCQALVYDPRNEAEEDVKALYARFETLEPWDSLGRLDRDSRFRPGA
jgi:hypothetical protein